jgi:hypothetical protein
MSVEHGEEQAPMTRVLVQFVGGNERGVRPVVPPDLRRPGEFVFVRASEAVDVLRELVEADRELRRGAVGVARADSEPRELTKITMSRCTACGTISGPNARMHDCYRLHNQWGEWESTHYESTELVDFVLVEGSNRPHDESGSGRADG